MPALELEHLSLVQAALACLPHLEHQTVCHAPQHRLHVIPVAEIGVEGFLLAERLRLRLARVQSPLIDAVRIFLQRHGVVAHQTLQHGCRRIGHLPDRAQPLRLKPRR